MSTFIDRLKTEKQELDEKIEKLTAFINSENFEKVDSIQAPLLQTQLSIMLAYSTVLDKRLNNLINI